MRRTPFDERRAAATCARLSLTVEPADVNSDVAVAAKSRRDRRRAGAAARQVSPDTPCIVPFICEGARANIALGAQHFAQRESAALKPSPADARHDDLTCVHKSPPASSLLTP